MGVSGTKEWSKHSVNCVTGCSHNCRYCYARVMAVRFGMCRREEWQDEKIRDEEVKKSRRKLNGTVMFPTTHDITPTNLDVCLGVLTKLLGAGNRVLVVSKPHLECIRRITEECRERKEQILFRFTIGAASDRFLSYWEGGAPGFDERLAALRDAYDAGYETSVSAEPCLDFANVDKLIELCQPYVTDSFWIGKLNKPRQRIMVECEKDQKALEWLIHNQRDEVIMDVYRRHKDNPKIKWKESIKKVVGIEVAEEAGLDM